MGLVKDLVRSLLSLFTGQGIFLVALMAGVMFIPGTFTTIEFGVLGFDALFGLVFLATIVAGLVSIQAEFEPPASEWTAFVTHAIEACIAVVLLTSLLLVTDAGGPLLHVVVPPVVYVAVYGAFAWIRHEQSLAAIKLPPEEPSAYIYGSGEKHWFTTEAPV